MNRQTAIYFDNAASTQMSPAVCEKIAQGLKDYANPAADHKAGLEAEGWITEAAGQIASLLKIEKEHIFFTSGATESNNWAILGTAAANRKEKNKAVSTKAEHLSVIKPLEQLQKQHYKIAYAPLGENGAVDENALLEQIDESTFLVSIMHVNNEIGTVHDIQRLCGKVKSRHPQALIHVDAAASFGKLDVFPSQWGVDLLTISSHKIHGPKGVGALYIRPGVKIHPLIYGGGQQLGLRSGTENTPGILGFGAAAGQCMAQMDENAAYVGMLKKRLWEGLKGNPSAHLIGGGGQSSPYILNVGFRGFKSAVIMQALSERQIYVSAGSACSGRKHSLSHVLQALPLEREIQEGSIRFSFSALNKMEEIEECLHAIEEILPGIQAVMG